MKHLILIFVVFFFTACEYEDESTKCLDCQETISCEKIGSIPFGCGDDANYNLNYCPLSYQVEKCDFETQDVPHPVNHPKIRGCNNGMTLWFPYTTLNGGSFSTGWKGKTDRGLKIGHSLKELQQRYPEAFLDKSNEKSDIWKSVYYKSTAFSLEFYCSIDFTINNQTDQLSHISILSIGNYHD